MTEIKDSERIIVGVDGSQGSVEALTHAARLASALHAPLEAIMAWEYPAILGAYYPLMEWSPQREAEGILADAVDRAFQGTPPHRFTQTTLPGPSARVLIEQSAHASMLVVGSRGIGGFAGLLLGSASAACAAHAHCPVLIVHTPGPATRTGRQRSE
ncbi:universal stress protein [Microbacterium profundi]|uniref:universal stress protein n=1 Tax=Microbacterium profundi TaxID=450380 RepID=UPI0019D2CFBE|nr:universal stress protein [Microbacterium profundi]MCE7481826.1 universal stress protein [Microbacterium profundi]